MRKNNVIEWLLEPNNPGIRFRTQTEILGESGDKSDVVNWILGKLPKTWFETKGLWYVYYLTALAESGLSKEDIPPKYIDKALDIIDHDFTYSCADFMLVRALIMLGYHNNAKVQHLLSTINEKSLPDGGYLCERIKKKFDYVPKSCYKADLHALLLLSECAKKGIYPSYGEELILYFLKRDIFYRSDKSSLILEDKEGWRNIDVFYPFEPMRVGIHNIVEAFSSLGYGNRNELKEAWQLMYSKCNEEGKLILEGTLTKSYLPKEKIGTPSKWAAFYLLLAEKEKTTIKNMY